MTRIRAAFIALIIASVALAAYGDRISGNGPEFLPRDDTEAGRAMSATAVPPTTQAEHNREIGHTISTQPTAACSIAF